MQRRSAASDPQLGPQGATSTGDPTRAAKAVRQRRRQRPRNDHGRASARCAHLLGVLKTGGSLAAARGAQPAAKRNACSAPRTPLPPSWDTEPLALRALDAQLCDASRAGQCFDGLVGELPTLVRRMQAFAAASGGAEAENDRDVCVPAALVLCDLTRLGAARPREVRPARLVISLSSCALPLLTASVSGARATVGRRRCARCSTWAWRARWWSPCSRTPRSRAQWLAASLPRPRPAASPSATRHHTRGATCRGCIARCAPRCGMAGLRRACGARGGAGPMSRGGSARLAHCSSPWVRGSSNTVRRRPHSPRPAAGVSCCAPLVSFCMFVC